MRNQGPEFPKPYTKVPFVSRAQRSQPAGHHRIDGELLTGVLELKMTCLRPVQVASGHQEFLTIDRREEIASFQARLTRYVDPNGGAKLSLAVVPGSSLKGAIRSVAEAVSFSCVRVSSRDTRRVLPPQLAGCHDSRALCPACRMFGMSGQGTSNHQGLLAFEDSYIRADGGNLVAVRTPLLWRPYLTGKPGRRMYHHGRLATDCDTRLAIRTGTELTVRAHLTNVSAADAGLLVTAVGCHPQYSFPIKLGGGKPVGMGSVRFALAAWQPCADVSGTGRMGRRASADGGDVLQLAQQWVRAAEAQGVLAKEQLAQVAQMWDERRLDDESPSGTY